MIPLQSKPKTLPASSMLNTRRRKRFSGGMFIGVGITLAVMLLAVGFFAVQKSSSSHAASVSTHGRHMGGITTINGLQNITQIGSTTNILDPNGNPITANPDPYKIAIAPANLSPNLKAGDVLVSNIGNDTQGITVVKFTQQPGTGRVFNVMSGNGDGILGPSGLVFDNGKLLVANATGNSVAVLNPNGTLFTTVKDPLFNGPWGITVGRSGSDSHGNQLMTFFTANKFDGKILRVNVTSSSNGGAPTFTVVQIGQYNLVGTVSKIDLHWMPFLQVGSKILIDVLLTIDPANNSVAAFAHSSALQAVGTPVTVFQGTPLNNPGGLALNPLNGDILVVNLNDNNLVELNAKMGTVVGVKQIDPTIVDAQGNNSALFGVIAIKDAQGNLKVFFTDDNTNTLNVLSA
jgi:hypothetical protein